MFIEDIIDCLNKNPGAIALLTACSVIISTIAALWLGSAYHEIRKLKKIKINLFETRIQKEILPKGKELYLKFDADERPQRVANTGSKPTTIQDSTNSNAISSFQYNLKIEHLFYDFLSEKYFLEYLEEKGLIKEYYLQINSANPFKGIYIIKPTVSFWNNVEKKYKLSKKYKKQKLLDFLKYFIECK